MDITQERENREIQEIKLLYMLSGVEFTPEFESGLSFDLGLEGGLPDGILWLESPIGINTGTLGHRERTKNGHI